MNKTVQDKNNEWERERVQRVLDYHNEKHGAHVELIDKAENVYPELKGQSNWDWVCYDTETDEEVAAEVKKLTDEKLEVSYNTIGDVLEEIKNDLLNKLPGTFLLSISISPKNYHLPLRRHQNKQKFKNVLCEAIFQTAQTLKLEEEQALTPQIIGQLPFALPDSFFCALYKFSDKGSALYKGSGVTGSWSPGLNEHELKEFERLVSHANEQLKLAKKEFNVGATFLVIIEEGLRMTLPSTIPDAFKSISRNSYSHADHAYCVSGEEVAEIPLPPP